MGLFDSFFAPKKTNTQQQNPDGSAQSGNNTKKKGFSFQYNNTAQKTLPYKAAYDNGIFELSDKVFSKTYFVEDANFEIVSQSLQDDLFSKFTSVLNGFNAETKVQFTVYNRIIDRDAFEKKVLMPMNGDKYDVFRSELNQVMLKNLQEGRNNIQKEIYITVTIEAGNFDEACSKFAYMDGQLDQSIKPINASGVKALSFKDRLSLLYDIYHPDDTGFINKTAVIDGHEVKAFDAVTADKQGTGTKDILAPSCFIFNANNFQIGETYGQAIYLHSLPNFLSTEFIAEINALPYNMLTSIHYHGLDQGKALQIVNNHLTSIDSGLIEKQQKAARSGYSPDLAVPHKMQESKEEAEKLLGDLQGRNQKLFHCTLVITHFADDEKTLDEQKKQILATASKFLVNMKVLSSQQEYGFNASIPLGVNKLTLNRMLTSEGSSLFIPFSTKELFDPKGIYYGLNAISHNIVMYDRTKSKNANGIILGTPGSGKSFAAKREMTSVLLSSQNTLFVIDPEGEFPSMGETYDGEIVKIAMGSTVYINPMDMDLNYGSDENSSGQDPVTLKADFIITICETIMGGRYGLSVVQKSIVDRCVRKVYEPYIKYMTEHPELGTIARDKMPTLKHLYNEILKQPEPEAKIIALALERFVTGSFDIFSHRTNVDISKKFVIYNIKDVGTGLKELATQICLNDVWNRTISNHSKGLRTFCYIDEFYLLTKTQSSISYLQELWKRARKWGGVMTGITQNVSDLFTSQEASTILSNSDFVLMMNQAPADRSKLAALYNISPVQLSYITNSPAGQGLLYNGSTIIPFRDQWPKDTLSYAAMTSSMDDMDLKNKLKAKLAEINGTS